MKPYETIQKPYRNQKPYRERRCGKTSYSLCILAGYHRYFFLSHLPCFQSASFVLLPTLAGHLRPILGFSGQFSLVAKRMNQVEEPSPNAKKIKSYIIYNLNIYLYIYIYVQKLYRLSRLYFWACLQPSWPIPAYKRHCLCWTMMCSF